MRSLLLVVRSLIHKERVHGVVLVRHLHWLYVNKSRHDYAVLSLMLNGQLKNNEMTLESCISIKLVALYSFRSNFWTSPSKVMNRGSPSSQEVTPGASHCWRL